MSLRPLRLRRLSACVVLVVGVMFAIITNSEMWQATPREPLNPAVATNGLASEKLKTIPIKGRAAKTGYERTQFGNGWESSGGCDTRNIILNRDLHDVVIGDACKVISGTLTDPYTAKRIEFRKGPLTSADIQIDHVVALSDAWQKGAQQLDKERRIALANDPLELLAVDGQANQDKSDGDAATWLPPNKAFRCQYVARQIAVKAKYDLWMTQAEADAIRNILERCPSQLLPT